MLIETIRTTLLQIFYKNTFFIPDLSSIVSQTHTTISKGTPNHEWVQNKRKPHSPRTSEYESE